MEDGRWLGKQTVDRRKVRPPCRDRDVPMRQLLKCNLVVLVKDGPMSSVRELEFNNVRIHRKNINRSRTNARDRVQYAFIGLSPFRFCSIEGRNAEPDRSFVPAWRSCSAAFRGTTDDRRQYQRQSG